MFFWRFKPNYTFSYHTVYFLTNSVVNWLLFVRYLIKTKISCHSTIILQVDFKFLWSIVFSYYIILLMWYDIWFELARILHSRIFLTYWKHLTCTVWFLHFLVWFSCSHSLSRFSHIFQFFEYILLAVCVREEISCRSECNFDRLLAVCGCQCRCQHDFFLRYWNGSKTYRWVESQQIICTSRKKKWRARTRSWKFPSNTFMPFKDPQQDDARNE